MAEPVRERDIEKYLKKRVKENGGDARRVTWIGRRGAPDDIVFLNGTHFVECKAPGGKAAPHQLREHHSIQKHGVTVWVLDTFKKIDDFVFWAVKGA